MTKKIRVDFSWKQVDADDIWQDRWTDKTLQIFADALDKVISPSSGSCLVSVDTESATAIYEVPDDFSEMMILNHDYQLGVEFLND